MKEYKVKVYEDRTEWYNQEGERHREDGPAIEWANNGHKKWYLNGKRHREDGPALEWADGDKSWYKDGQLHRLDGPAFELSDGYKSWYKDGRLHREDGPAIEFANGNKEWWINGQELTESEFNQKMNPVELTMEQIAKLAGVPVSQLKIKK